MSLPMIPWLSNCRLSQLGSDINEIDKYVLFSRSSLTMDVLTDNVICREKGQTALHHVVTRGFLHMVNYLTGGSEGWDDSDPLSAQCRKQFHNVINLDIQDCNGDTALHLASR